MHYKYTTLRPDQLTFDDMQRHTERTELVTNLVTSYGGGNGEGRGHGEVDGRA